MLKLRMIENNITMVHFITSNDWCVSAHADVTPQIMLAPNQTELIHTPYCVCHFPLLAFKVKDLTVWLGSVDDVTKHPLGMWLLFLHHSGQLCLDKKEVWIRHDFLSTCIEISLSWTDHHCTNKINEYRSADKINYCVCLHGKIICFVVVLPSPLRQKGSNAINCQKVSMSVECGQL